MGASRHAVFTRSRTLFLVLLLGLAAHSLKPIELVERALDLLFLPARILPELAAPLRWMRAGEVRAAELHLARGEAEARERALALFADEQDAALPASPELRAGLRLLHGELVRRGRRDLDRAVVRVATLAGVEAGLPVVAGEHYVGRVARIVPGSPSEALVEVALVTGADFFVGAELALEDAALSHAAPTRLVVGGLAPQLGSGREEHFLAVHNPSSKVAAAGVVLVREPRFSAPSSGGERWPRDPWAALAAGFRLGRLEVLGLEGGAELLRVRPGIDYQSGLFQVLVLASATSEEPAGEQRLPLDTFAPGSWIAAAALTAGEANPARAGRRFALAPGARVRPGAAVALGGHILGRVERAGLLAADARLLGDPGLALAALARIDGEARPRPLGEIVGLGRRRADGALLFRWNARVPLGGEGAPALAELFTGSGLEGVPRGLCIGSGELPRTAGRHVIAVHQDPAAQASGRALLWVGRPAEEEGP